jgi:hypothetical protein
MQRTWFRSISIVVAMVTSAAIAAATIASAVAQIPAPDGRVDGSLAVANRTSSTDWRPTSPCRSQGAGLAAAIPMVGGSSLPAGTYRVQIVCHDISDWTFDRGSLVVMGSAM